MSLTKSQAPRVHWHPVNGWLVDTVFPMTRAQLKVCIDYTRKVQAQRIAGMPRGELREQAEKALLALSVNTIRQNLQSKSPWERDKIAFMGDGGAEKSKIISLGANHG